MFLVSNETNRNRNPLVSNRNEIEFVSKSFQILPNRIRIYRQFTKSHQHLPKLYQIKTMYDLAFMSASSAASSSRRPAPSGAADTKKAKREVGAKWGKSPAVNLPALDQERRYKAASKAGLLLEELDCFSTFGPEIQRAADLGRLLAAKVGMPFGRAWR